MAVPSLIVTAVIVCMMSYMCINMIHVKDCSHLNSLEGESQHQYHFKMSIRDSWTSKKLNFMRVYQKFMICLLQCPTMRSTTNKECWASIARCLIHELYNRYILLCACNETQADTSSQVSHVVGCSTPWLCQHEYQESYRWLNSSSSIRLEVRTTQIRSTQTHRASRARRK